MEKKSYRKRIAVLAPAYNESCNIVQFINALEAVKRGIGSEYELSTYLIDDGSTDDTWEKITKQASINRWVHGIKFSRNFGKECAITAGIDTVNGDAVIIADVDGEHPLEAIPAFIKEWERGSLHVVGIRNTHASASAIKNLTSWSYHKIMKKISGPSYVPRASDYRLIDSKIVKEFRTLKEHNRVARQLIDWLGFNPTFVEYDSPPRWSGEPSYSMRKLFELAINGVVANTMAPLRIAAKIGVWISVTCIIVATVFMVNSLMGDKLNLGISSLGYITLMIVFLAGLQLSCMGLLSIYIESIVSNSRNRPLYVIESSI